MYSCWVVCMCCIGALAHLASFVGKHAIRRPEGLQLLCWQAKTERFRRGSRVAIGNISLSGHSWLQVGFDLIYLLAPRDYWLGDCVICANSVQEVNVLAPQSCHTFLHTFARALHDDHQPERLGGCVEARDVGVIEGFHRTVVSALRHGNMKQTTIQSQGRWKSPSMVQKFQRNGTLLTTAAVAELREEGAQHGHLHSESDLSEANILINLSFILMKFMKPLLLVKREGLSAS